MKGISIWWCREGSGTARGGRPDGLGSVGCPSAGGFNLSPLADLYIFKFFSLFIYLFIFPGEVQIPPEQMSARWQEARVSQFPFMDLLTPSVCSLCKLERRGAGGSGWDLSAAQHRG